MSGQRWLALSLAAVFYLSFLAVWSIGAGTQHMPLPETLRRVCVWRLPMAVHGRHPWLRAALAHGGSGRARYLTDAIFPYYIVHQTAIIMIAHALHGQHLAAWLEASIVIAGTAGVRVDL